MIYNKCEFLFLFFRAGRDDITRSPNDVWKKLGNFKSKSKIALFWKTSEQHSVLSSSGLLQKWRISAQGIEKFENSSVSFHISLALRLLQ